MEPITIKPNKTKIDEKLKNDLKTLCEEESQVIVHCKVLTTRGVRLRIWKNTNLIAHGSGKKSRMTHAENITFHPEWMWCTKGQYNFTLFFKALPKNCKFFDLFEDIPELGGFVDETDDIVESFQPYYTSTILTEQTDPDKLYQMLYEIEQYNLYTQYQIDEFCKEFYSDSDSDQKLHPIIDVVVDTNNERLNEEEQDEFKSKIQSFIRMYSYISQISSFGEVKWEKSYVFLRFWRWY